MYLFQSAILLLLVCVKNSFESKRLAIGSWCHFELHPEIVHSGERATKLLDMLRNVFFFFFFLYIHVKLFPFYVHGTRYFFFGCLITKTDNNPPRQTRQPTVMGTIEVYFTSTIGNVFLFFFFKLASFGWSLKFSEECPV